jgi:hypothetical protein
MHTDIILYVLLNIQNVKLFQTKVTDFNEIYCLVYVSTFYDELLFYIFNEVQFELHVNEEVIVDQQHSKSILFYTI